MIMRMKHDGWLVEYWYEIGMYDKSLIWLVRHGYGMEWT